MITSANPRKRSGSRYSRLSLRLLVVLLATSLVAAGSLQASVRVGSGFGHAGLVTIGKGEILSLGAVPTGGVIAVGYSGRSMLVARIGTNGSSGRPFNAGQGVATSVVVQPDGKIVVAGTTAPKGKASFPGDMVVKRFNANGSPDRTFGSRGTTRLRGAIANAVALGQRGTIVAAGSIAGADGSPRVALARLQANGAADRTFGSNGFSEIDLGPYSEANAVAVQRDGRVVFAGDQSPGLQDVNALVGRTSSNGALDRSFGRGGLYTYEHPHGGGASSFEALAIDSAGRIIAAGCDVENSGQHALFVRLQARGSTDSGFGSGGVLTTPSEEFADTGALVGVRALGIAPGGEILAAGDYLDSGESFAALWAIRGGRLDGRQGQGGLVKTTLSAALGGESRAIAIGSKTTVYAAGDVLGTSTTRGFVTRYTVSGL